MSKIITLDRLSDFLTNLKGLFVIKTDANSTYATKGELNSAKTTADDTYLSKLDAKATYLTSNNLNGYTHTDNTIALTGNAIGSGNIDRDGNVSIATTVNYATNANHAATADNGGGVRTLDGSSGAVNLSNLASFGQYLNSNGYKKLPGGLLIQWVTVTFNLPTTLSSYYVLSASFPIAFKSTPFFSSVSVGNCDSIEAGEFSAGLCNVSTTGADIRIIRLCGSDDTNTEVSRISILAFGTY